MSAVRRNTEQDDSDSDSRSAAAVLPGPAGRCRRGGVLPSEGVAELRGSHADRPSKYLSEMARTRIAHFERDFDEAAGRFADQSLRSQHSLSGYKLKRRHPRALLEPPSEMEGTQLRQFRQPLDRDAFREV